MSTNLRAVLIGVTVTVVLDIGYFFITSEPASGGVFIGSATAGYLCDHSIRNSAWHGGLTGIFGTSALVVLVTFSPVAGGFPTTVVADLFDIGLLGSLLGVLVVVSVSLPTVITGVLGGVAGIVVRKLDSLI